MNDGLLLSAGVMETLSTKVNRKIKAYIESVLIMHNNHCGKVSKTLGVSGPTLTKKFKKYGIKRVGKRKNESSTSQDNIPTLVCKIDEVTKDYIETVLIIKNYHMRRASKTLGISVVSLYRYRIKYGIENKALK